MNPLSRERRQWRLTFPAGTSKDPIALGNCWVGRCSPKTPRREQRWQCSYRNYEGTRDVQLLVNLWRWQRDLTGFAAAPEVLPLAMVASRLCSSR